MLKKILLLAVLAGVGLSRSAYGVGIAVTPAEKTLKVKQGDEVRAEFEVTNPSNEVALFEIYSDEFENFIKIQPSKFTLESGESKDFSIRVSPPRAGTYLTTVSVSAKPLGDIYFGMGSGVKIPVSITSEDKSNTLASISDNLKNNSYIIFAAILAAYLTLRAVRMIRGRKSKEEKAGQL